MTWGTGRERIPIAPAEKVAAGSPRIIIDSLNLEAADRRLTEAALIAAGSIVEAAQLLGTSRKGVIRRIIKHQIAWPQARRAEA